jgi:hypothetical protein
MIVVDPILAFSSLADGIAQLDGALVIHQHLDELWWCFAPKNEGGSRAMTLKRY